MNEIFYLIFQVLFIFILFCTPIIFFNGFYLKKYTNNYSNLDKIVLNVVLFFNLLLISLILNLNYKSLFFFLIILYLALFLLNLKNFNYKSVKFDYFILIVFFLTFVLSLDLIHNLALGWDGQKVWGLKALNFFQSNTLSNLKIFIYPNYPFLLSYLFSFFLSEGSNNESNFFSDLIYCSLSRREFSNKILFCFSIVLLL